MQPDALTRPFEPKEILHFQGRGGREMSYVEDEAVMDRLDEAFGIGGWSVLVEPIPVYEGVVKVRLGANIDGNWVWHEDFGYPNREGGEALKEAVSDGIRRCGRMFGIARDLYRKDQGRGTTNGAAVPPQVAAAPAPSPAGRGSPSPRPAASTVPPEPEWMDGPRQPVGGIEPGAEDGTCPQHGKPWRENAKGFYCGTPVSKGPDGSVTKWCDEKPTQRWVTSRGLVSAR